LASRQDKTSVAMGYALSDKVQLGINLSMEKKNGHKLQRKARENDCDSTHRG
jgi:hypothetical protein